MNNVKSISDFDNDNGIVDADAADDVDHSNITITITTTIVNVASRCGFTHVNYRGLRELYDTWGPKGLEILAFPSNEFGNQEPGSNEEIQLFCRDYGLSFPVMAKVDVNGLNSHPLFEYLKLKTGHTQIAWNFEKFLVVNGEPVKRYRSRVPPAGINDDDDTCDDNDTNDDEIDVEN